MNLETNLGVNCLRPGDRVLVTAGCSYAGWRGVVEYLTDNGLVAVYLDQPPIGQEETAQLIHESYLTKIPAAP